MQAIPKIDKINFNFRLLIIYSIVDYRKTKIMNTENIKHILMPIDFSDCAINAKNTAIIIAKRQGSKITLLEIIPAVPANYGLSIDNIVIKQQDTVLQNSEAKLKLLAAEISYKHKIDVNYICLLGETITLICETAKVQNVDLIVMGTHGVSGFKEFFIGSNSFAVVEKAKCPVLIIPLATAISEFKQIMFPVRNIPNALGKYTFLRKIIDVNKSNLVVFGVDDASVHEAINHLMESVNYFNHSIKDDDVTTTTCFMVKDANLADEVLNKTKEMNCDLIVITSKLDTTFTEYFMGTFTQRIVNHSTVAVLHVR